MNQPPELDKHNADYQPQAWRHYTDEELTWWVRLLRKRAGMRTDPVKAAKDREDADNYERMLSCL